MPAAVIPIGEWKREHTAKTRPAHWSLLELAVGDALIPFGILFVDNATNELSTSCRTLAEVTDLRELDEQQQDILDSLEEDLRQKAAENGGAELLDSLEDTLSGFFRISDRAAIAYSGSPQAAADRLFDEFVDPDIRRYETHLPLYGLRAAATKFGESMAAGERAGDEEAWIRVRNSRLRLSPGMFVAHVVGRSMEPLIPDNSLCVFRSDVKGTRAGKRLLIEKFGESDFASRYTVKRYTSIKRKSDETESGWEHDKIRLEPLNPEFEAFELGPDEFRVIAEFVEVLGHAPDFPNE